HRPRTCGPEGARPARAGLHRPCTELYLRRRHYLEYVSFGQFLEAGQRSGELEKGSKVLTVTFVAHRQPAIAAQPRQGAFDLPSVTAEAFAAVDTATGDPRNDAPCPQPPAVYGIVVTLVRPHPAGPAAARTTRRAHRWNRSDHRLQHDTVVGVCRGHRRDEGNAVGVGEDVDLRAVLASIDRAGTGQRSPLFARTCAASRIAADQSRSPPAPSRSRTRRCSSSNTPARTQVVKRRCAVGTLTPNDAGRCRQAQPLVST